ncbi:MAG: hypothetical protein AMJ92_05750 [candidate division Zixibacteria bacterium SM23_81]|nr:MAG: hypothetical protein AMJ92_05750 [candidate division Zixibacteria bacterium SM23_81]
MLGITEGEGKAVKVKVQVSILPDSGDVQIQVLKYDVTYDQKLRVARWQLLPGQGELIRPSVAIPRNCHLSINIPRKG